MTMPRAALILLVALGLGACGDNTPAPKPPPRELTRAANGNYCNMIVIDHLGPKAQVFVSNRNDPLWFPSVRDAMFYRLLPEDDSTVIAIYVNDMTGQNWDHPDPKSWVDADKAWYVINSNKVGGMGAPEAVPFATRNAAVDFSRRHGGDVRRLKEIPSSYFLDPVDTPVPGAPSVPGAIDEAPKP
ncbi:nitrous oxide reductase accessory protein NosL [Varunaivibrio sulfuroxidans]|uniref:Copper chaperone NosL n=1 Tax=Varunaivibrio sulfuroxidans TaxID=1773489 RepID=A0A4R3JDS3_9PROT|nr:nitrous oxide reductase accessory protein NosL [Varunaivibrio sulfuroxidans]TCS63992.1 copper chaperone NosL [Varunaivibrio sulfuroxidans]WES31555.1 nitrous oxide reductase accessory protein NosL [Varunaivibrio sulfuroxidans]